MNDYFRLYTNTDVIGVEIGAALKTLSQSGLARCMVSDMAIIRKLL